MTMKFIPLSLKGFRLQVTYILKGVKISHIFLNNITQAVSDPLISVKY